MKEDDLPNVLITVPACDERNWIFCIFAFNRDFCILQIKYSYYFGSVFGFVHGYLDFNGEILLSTGINGYSYHILLSHLKLFEYQPLGSL